MRKREMMEHIIELQADKIARLEAEASEFESRLAQERRKTGNWYQEYVAAHAQNVQAALSVSEAPW